MEKNKNPNAFPTRSEHEDPSRADVSGMSLRDYFAAKYMQANADNEDYMWEDLTKHSYEVADKMLEERLKTTP